MIRAFLPILALVPQLALAEASQTATTTATSIVTLKSLGADRSYGLALNVDAKLCAETRFLVLGDGVQAVSKPVAAGHGIVLVLGLGFSEGPHPLHITALDCAAAPKDVVQLTLGQQSPGHGRGLLLEQVSAVAQD